MKSSWNRISENESERSVGISRHAEMRRKQRGYVAGDVDLVFQYGTPAKGGVLLTNKDVERAKHDVKCHIGRLERLAGTVVIVKGNVVASVYRPRTCQRRRMTRKTTPRSRNRWIKTRGKRS